MRIERWAAGDPEVTRACFGLANVVTAADDPDGPRWSASWFRAWLEDAVAPGEMWLASGETPGQVLGWCHLDLPDLDNRDRAGVNLIVHPAFRRRGIGSALLAHAARRAAGHGRSVLGTEVPSFAEPGSAGHGSAGDGSPGHGSAAGGSPGHGSGSGPGAPAPTAGESFARRAGARAGLVDARRVFDSGKADAELIERLRERAAAAAAGYRLVSWLGATPEEYLPGVAAMLNALNDAPRDAGREPARWDAARVRERIDGPYRKRGGPLYSVAALAGASGPMAALTQIEVAPDLPGWGHQMITAVAGEHRGHRLGLLVKAVSHQWLAEAEPEPRRIVTWNAAGNQHMIAINAALGYEVLEPYWQSYDLPVAAALALG